MTARPLNPLRRIAAMDAREVGFRLQCELHKAADRARWAMSPPAWRRSAIRDVLGHAAPSESLFLSAARSSIDAGDWTAVHRALARHVVHRPPAFPLQPTTIESLVAGIHSRFPDAGARSAARADRILTGRFDLLGYTGLDFGHPPRWHYDPVHGRHAAGGFWSTVPYLDPLSGDHKIIWELNRHQHWLALGRAYHLTADRRYYEEFVHQLQHWLAENPPLAGVNWASMLELAFRSLSWLWAAHLFAPAAIDEHEPAAPWMVDLLVGLDRQLTHVERNLSRYFSPNTHLTGEALALFVSGAALPELRASARRLAIGREVLVQEASRQVLADGGHAERSAHYHRYSTDFYLLALQVARRTDDPSAAIFETAARAQARYLRALADDSGRLPLLGDDDGGQLFPVCGRAPSDCRDTLAGAAVLLDEPSLTCGELPEEVFWLCGSTVPLENVRIEPVPPRQASIALPDSGYYVSRTTEGDHLVFDAGPHGFRNGGHAHSDALAIVASVGGTPLFVDPGTATYTMDPALRDRFRSTAMHNTVVINGTAQSQPAGPFHWARATDASASVWRTGEGADYVEARHDGYAPLVHARAIVALHGHAWFIIDHLLHPQPGTGGIAADTFWHLHPDWALASPPGADSLLQHADGRTHRLASSGILTSVRGTAFADLAAYAAAYGRIEPAECLRMSSNGPVPRSTLTVVPLSGCRATALTIEPLVLSEPPAPGWHAAAFLVRFDDAEAVLLASVEQSGIPSSHLAAPPARWGTADVQTVGRAALLLSDATGWNALLVNGRHLAGGSAALNYDLAQPLIHVRADAADIVTAAVELRT
ncbi:alginate lyase family protein [soil metagenome]